MDKNTRNTRNIRDIRNRRSRRSRRRESVKFTINRKKGLFSAISICSILLILIVRLAFIMIYKSKEYRSMAQGQWNSQVTVEAKRGNIKDRNGSILATSIDVYRVDIDLNAIDIHIQDEDTTKEEVARKLAETTGIPYEEVLQKLSPVNEDGVEVNTTTLITGIEKALADEIKALDIYGLVISISPKRYYPNNNFLSHVLGSVNSDNVGLNGVELEYDSELTGISGYKIAEIDGSLKELPYQTVKYTSPIDGKDLTLTIDENIQLIAENVAEKGMTDNKAEEVTIIVMDPNNGEVLALVNKPDFNPNTPYDDYENFDGENEFEKLQNMFRNNAISNTFEPGSTFKNITMSAAIEEGLVNENDTFYCGGSLKFGSTIIKCWNTAGHGTQTLPEILQNSCNVGFMEIGARIGGDKLTEWIKKMGFGTVSGIDLPGEAKGIIKKAESITESDLATIAFGQTNTVNASQYMAAFNAIANGGTLIQPHVMKEVSHLDENGVRIIDETFVPVKKENLISEENAAILRDYLERTVTEGGSSKSYVEGYHIGSKTGTAQKVNPENGTYGAGKYISSMGGMAPADDPQITVFISIDEPSSGAYYAGQIVAPIGKTLFTDIFNYMETEFPKDDTQGIIKEIIIPEIRGLEVGEAKKNLKDTNLEYSIEGNGNIITDVKPNPGYTVKEGSKIVLYTGTGGTYNKTIAMPDLRGYSIESVAKILSSLGITYNVEGEGVVIKQSIPKGELISSSTEVKLTLNSEYGD